MRRSAVVWVLLAGGCLDKNPVFVDETATGAMATDTTAPMTMSGESTSRPTTDPQPTTDPNPTDAQPTTAVSDTEVLATEPHETTGATDFPGTATSTSETGTSETGTDVSGSTVDPPVCGDGVVQDPEQCDDGNQSEADACLSDCVMAICGDGHHHLGKEECDDGNDIKGDGCEPTCEVTPPRIVFVTSEVFSVEQLGGLLGADERCNILAMLADLPGPYQAWLSDDMASPKERMVKYKVPYVNTMMMPIAPDWNGLASSMHLAPINLTEKKGPPPPSSQSSCGINGVWTNTNDLGEDLGEDCGGWMVPVGPTTWGSTKPLKMWSEACFNDLCGLQAPLFCVQQ